MRFKGYAVQKVILEGYIEVPEKDMEIVEMELPIHTDLTKNEKGCIVFKITKDKAIENRFNIYEEFNSAEAFEYHQKRIKASRWGAISKNVVRNYQVKYCVG